MFIVAHGYTAYETVAHVLYEMVTWFDRYVKNAPTATQSNNTDRK